MLWKDTTFEPVDKYYTIHQKLHSFTTNCENKQQFNYHKFKSKHWSSLKATFVWYWKCRQKFHSQLCMQFSGLSFYSKVFEHAKSLGGIHCNVDNFKIQYAIWMTILITPLCAHRMNVQTFTLKFQVVAEKTAKTYFFDTPCTVLQFATALNYILIHIFFLI